MTTSPSGADIARIALQAARADARAKGQGGNSRKHRGMAVIERRRNNRDPSTLDSAIKGLIATRGWNLETQAGTINDRWRELAPEDTAAVAAPEHYDAEQRVLYLRPDSPAAASMLRWNGAKLAAHLNQRLGQDLVATIKVLPPGQPREADAKRPPASSSTNETDPHRQRPLRPSPEMLAWRQREAARRAARETAPPRPVHPLFEGAYGALREPEPEPPPTTEAEDTAARAARAAEVHAKALAVARRQQRPGDPPVLRSLGAA